MDDLSQKIEKIVEEMGTLSPKSARYKTLETKLCKLLFTAKGFADIFQYQDEGVKSQEKRHFEYFDSLVFTEVLQSALKDFRNPAKGLDKDGKKKTFLHLFNTYYKVKEPEVKATQSEEGSYGGLKEKRKYVRNVINVILKNHKAKTVYTDYNVFNAEKVKELLLNVGATEDEVQGYEHALKLNLNSMVLGEDEDGKSLEDPTAAEEEYQLRQASEKERQAALEEIIRRTGLALKQYQGKKMELHIKMFCSSRICPWLQELNAESFRSIAAYLDRKFLGYCLEAYKGGENSEISIWANYLNCPRDSARKLIKRIEKALKEIE